MSWVESPFFSGAEIWQTAIGELENGEQLSELANSNPISKQQAVCEWCEMGVPLTVLATENSHPVCNHLSQKWAMKFVNVRATSSALLVFTQDRTAVGSSPKMMCWTCFATGIFLLAKKCLQ